MKRVFLNFRNFSFKSSIPFLSFFHDDEDVKVIFSEQGNLMKRDEFSGKGSFLTTKKEKYEGNFVKGKKEGIGKYFYSNNDYYEGNWKNDARNGEGCLFFSNGDYFKGLFVEDGVPADGFVEYKKGNAIFKGSMENGKEEGKGWLKYENGDIYEGNFHLGRRHGKGIYKSNPLDGFTYNGEFKFGDRHGKGIFEIEKLKFYFEGEFERNNPVRGMIKTIVGEQIIYVSGDVDKNFQICGKTVSFFDKNKKLISVHDLLKDKK